MRRLELLCRAVAHFHGLIMLHEEKGGLGQAMQVKYYP